MIRTLWKLYFLLFCGALTSCSTDIFLSSRTSNKEVVGQLSDYWDLFESHAASSPDSAFFYINMVKQLAESSGKEEWLAASYGAIGDMHLEQGLLDESIDHYLKAIKLFKSLGELSQVANAYVSIGVIYEKQKDYQQAINFNLKARDIFIYEGSSADKAKVSRNLALYYTELKAFKEAQNYLAQAEKLSLETKDYHRLSLVYNSFGVLYLKQKEYQQAQKFYYLTIQYSDSIENGERQKFMALHNLGESYFLEGNYPEAKVWLRQAILKKKDLGNLNLVQNSYNLLAKIYNVEGQYADALALLEESLENVSPEVVDNSVNESLALINQALVKMNEEADPSELPYLNKKLGSYSGKFLAYNKRISSLREELETISHQQAVQAAVERHAFNEQLRASEEVNAKMRYAFLIPVILLIIAIISVVMAVKKNMHYKKLYSNIEKVLNNSKALRHLK